jgi:demethylmenaquinone methyltransferase/2-methoxy-6-polyprenyl-1,4-benzoquinol methylase
LALAFHRYTKGQSPIVASDFCGEMLEIGRRKRDKAKIAADKMEFVEADAQQLPFESDRFAVVSVAFGLRNVADTDQGLRELTRVCKPGGQVAVLEFSTPTWQPFKGLYGFYFRNVLPRIGQMLARNSSAAYEYLPQSVGLFPQGQELASKMEAAGLHDVKWYSLTFGIATLYVGRK